MAAEDFHLVSALGLLDADVNSLIVILAALPNSLATSELCDLSTMKQPHAQGAVMSGLAGHYAAKLDMLLICA